MQTMGKMLLLLGGSMFLLGVVFVVLGRFPGVGRLPGDILIHKGNITLYIPLVTMLLASLVVTIVVNIILRLFRG